MHLISPLLISLLALCPSTTLAAKAKAPKNAILLSQVKTLTLRSGAQTSHRRVPAIPQLTCTGPGCAHYTIDVMRCQNQGSAYSDEDIEWSCVASLPGEFKLGSTEVTCEGYGSRDDEYVLKGSCGVEYRLLLTEQGEEKYGKPGFWSGGSKNGGKEGWTFGSILFVILFLGVAGWILWGMFNALPAAGNRIPRRPGGGWGGGGGGPDDPWDPPPPYPGKRSYSSRRQQEGWRPGFWTGAMGGAAAGYAAGSAANRQQPQPQQNTGWFGGNTGGGYTAPRRTSSSSSSTRHSSTGFGSTSRR